LTLPPLDPYPVRPSQSSSITPSSPTEHQTTPSAPEKKASERAREAYLRNDYDTAASFYQEAISSGEDTGENRQKLGMCLYNLNKREAALSHFKRAVELYTAQKASGGDSAALSRAIDTCRLYIDDLSRR
jgi:tetratricopeptide (TPR) repeat protein